MGQNPPSFHVIQRFVSPGVLTPAERERGGGERERGGAVGGAQLTDRRHEYTRVSVRQLYRVDAHTTPRRRSRGGAGVICGARCSSSGSSSGSSSSVGLCTESRGEDALLFAGGFAPQGSVLLTSRTLLQPCTDSQLCPRASHTARRVVIASKKQTKNKSAFL